MREPLPPTSRRRVLAGAAWTAPVIVAASAAPAFAASGDALVSTVASGATDFDAAEMTVTVAFTNVNTGSTDATGLTVTLDIEAGLLGTTVTNVGGDAGFSFVSITGNGLQRVLTFTGTGIPGAPDASSTRNSTLSFTISLFSGVGVGTIATSADPTNGMVTDGVGAFA